MMSSMVRRRLRVRSSSEVLRQVLGRDELDRVYGGGGGKGSTMAAWRRPHRLTWSLLVSIVHLVSFFVRISLFSISLLQADSELQWLLQHFDPAVATIDRHMVHSSLFGLTWCSIGVVCLTFLYQVHLKPNPRIWRVAISPLVLTNSERFFSLNPDLRLDGLNGWLQFGQRFRRLWHHCERARFQVAQLPHYPNLSVRMRTRAVAITWLWERFEQKFYRFIVILFSSVWLSMTLLIWHDYSLPLMVIGSLDLAIVIFYFYRTAQHALFVTECFSLASLTVGWHLTRLRNQLTQSLGFNDRLRSNSRSSSLSCDQQQSTTRLRYLWLTMKLASYREANCRHLNDMAILNQGAVSDLMLACVSLLLVFSVYFVSMVFFRTVSTMAKVLFSIYMFSFCLTMGTNLVPMIKVVDRLYAGAKLFGRLVPYFEGPGMIGAKLKTAVHYEVLHTHRKLRYTIGQLAPVCWDTVFKFALLYSAYLMYTFKMFIEGKLV